ncbi:MAG: 6-phosphofructokinase, partial [Spirochaetes bacterium]|nr:6-phosphofructokinase [Spirochaetota bacterium]
MSDNYDDLLKFDLNIKNLGKCNYDSPLNLSEIIGDNVVNYINENERVFVINTKDQFDTYIKSGKNVPTFEKAGPRKRIFFKSGSTVSAIVTCGGLCPGLNAVIRALVLMNYYRYNNKIIYGIKHGYQGFIDKY